MQVIFCTREILSENLKTPLPSSQLTGAEVNLFAQERNEVPILGFALLLIWSNQHDLPHHEMQAHLCPVLANNQGKGLQILQWEKEAPQGERTPQQPQSRLVQIAADLHPSSQA